MCQPVSSDNDGVASFLELLLLMLDGSPTNQQVFFLSEGPATIGTLLQKVYHQPLVKMDFICQFGENSVLSSITMRQVSCNIKVRFTKRTLRTCIWE